MLVRRFGRCSSTQHIAMQNAPHRFRLVPRSSTSIGSVVFAALFFSANVRADVATCAQMHADGQREVRAGHLTRATALFAACGSTDGCPDAIVAECAELHRETQTNTPTTIFVVLDANGTDLTEVKVYAGDTLLQDGLNGRAVPLDPGKYALRFVLPSGMSLTSEALVREGEKNRIVSVRLPSPSPVAPRPERRPSALPASFWITAGVGAAALASFGVFAALGHAQQSSLDDCSPQCPSSRRDDFDSMRRDYLVSDVSLGLGAVSLGAAAWIFFSNESRSRGTARTNARPGLVSVVPEFLPDGGRLVANGVLF